MPKYLPLSIAPLILLAGCGEEPITGFVPDVHRIEVVPDSVVLSSVGQTVELEARALDISGVEVPRVTVAWSASPEAIVSVDADGRVTPLSKGVTHVVARVGEVEGVAVVTVTIQGKIDP